MANLEAWGWAGSSKWFASCGSYFSTDDGTALVKKAADAAINKKLERGFNAFHWWWSLMNWRFSCISSFSSRAFERKLIQFHEKYQHYVNECFVNHSLSLKTLKVAFEVCCNKKVAGCKSGTIY
uniref:Uncharacterized protein n=1 Tax=Physcomitrium patens TaxID=3218 RepID=A0A7I4CNU7_PHYPA|nr:putative cullin-like protein 1 isoform X3 [Physcomitrium patens]|eukprot:XP_024365189.1 putative cullin-like protein 1 isoform X3 [Physcomitrella patens]